MNTSQDQNRRNKLEADLLELVGFPSVTGSEEENRIARHIHARLQGLPYFAKHPAQLRLITSKPPDLPHPLQAVFALVKAKEPTRKTVLLISHFDVVGVDNFGSLQDWAFDPPALREKLAGAQLPPEAAQDLHSGAYLFGRGVMDMKSGLALEMDIIEEFSRDPGLFDVNIAFLAVGDEENNNAGMRQGVRFLHQAGKELDIDIACVLNTEPSDAGRPGTREQMIFLGTTGKLLPFFYIQGFGTHAGNYYQGLSASLLASYLQTLIEVNPGLVDFDQGEIPPPPLCLGLELRQREYSVTLPDRVATFFNTFALRKPPSQIHKEMRQMAGEAVDRTLAHITGSYQEMKSLGYNGPESRVRVLVTSFEELVAQIRATFAGDLDRELTQCAQHLPQDLDVREKGFCLVEKLLELRQEQTPVVVTGFLPPFLPPRTSLGDSAKEIALREAAEHLQAYSRQKHGTRLESAVYFGGICDLSYAGCDFQAEELEMVARNIPGWGAIYTIPFEEIIALDGPVINIGPRGRDAHKMTERLETDYTFRVLPDLLRFFIHQFEE